MKWQIQVPTGESSSMKREVTHMAGHYSYGYGGVAESWGVKVAEGYSVTVYDTFTGVDKFPLAALFMGVIFVLIIVDSLEIKQRKKEGSS